MSIEQLTEETRQRALTADPLGAVVMFQFPDGERIRVDGTQTPPVVDNQDMPAKATLRLDRDLYRRIMQGEADATASFMLGRIKIEGDLGVAMKVQALLEG